MRRDPNVIFEGSIPENYDRYLGPAFFEPFANDAAVLVATDLNPGMLAFAQGKFSASENVEWQEADAGALQFPGSSFDAVVCQLGLMFVPDKESAMRECYRVLNRNGVFLFNVWDSIDRNPIGQIAHQTIASFFECEPPNFYELPFGFYDADLIRGLLQSAGFKAIEASLVTLPCRSTSAADFAIGLVRGNPVATAIEERGVEVTAVVDAVSQKIAERYGTAPVESTMQAFVWRALHE